jgi:hypothetical protein
MLMIDGAAPDNVCGNPYVYAAPEPVYIFGRNAALFTLAVFSATL